MITLTSIAEELMLYAEAKKLGRRGIELFAHDWPENASTGCNHSVMFIESSAGTLNRLLSGDVSSQHEFMSVFVRSKTEKDSRERIAPIVDLLEGVRRQIIGVSFYHSVLSVVPVHFVGTDKNGLCICEVPFVIHRSKNS